MRVLCAWTQLRPETRAALDEHARDHEVIYEDCRGREEAYFEAIERLWNAGASFVTVEHDIVIHDQVFQGFQECQEPWCGHAYDLAVGLRPALGCTRFRAELLAAMPDAMAETKLEATSGVPPMAWYRIDVRLEQILQKAGYRQHVHEPPVVHLNETNRMRQ